VSVTALPKLKPNGTKILMLLVLSFQDIEKKYPGFIHMKLLQGIKLSFRLQQIVQERILINFFSSSLMPWLDKPEHL